MKIEHGGLFFVCVQAVFKQTTSPTRSVVVRSLMDLRTMPHRQIYVDPFGTGTYRNCMPY